MPRDVIYWPLKKLGIRVWFDWLKLCFQCIGMLKVALELMVLWVMILSVNSVQSSVGVLIVGPTSMHKNI